MHSKVTILNSWTRSEHRTGSWPSSDGFSIAYKVFDNHFELSMIADISGANGQAANRNFYNKIVNCMTQMKDLHEKSTKLSSDSTKSCNALLKARL